MSDARLAPLAFASEIRHMSSGRMYRLFCGGACAESFVQVRRDLWHQQRFLNLFAAVAMWIYV